MTIAALPPVPGRRTLGKAVATLTITQLIGWSTTFHIPAVLSDRIAPSVGLSREFVFGGLTIMLLIAAFMAPRCARILERYGARTPMILGSVATGCGLAALALAQGPLTFGLAWVIIGLAMPFTLNQAASTALVQISPERARSALALMLMLTGVSAMVAWPTLLWLDGEVGWRRAVLVCAGLNVLVCAPLHRLGLPGGSAGSIRQAPLDRGAPIAIAPPIPGAFPLAALSFSVSGMLTWGLPLTMISLLRDLGHTEAGAVWVGSLFAPAQVLARGFEMLGGRRLPILTVGVIAMGVMPIALVVLLFAGGSPVGAAVFAVGYGIAAGLGSIVRAVGPIRLFGPAAYASALGRLSVPQNIAFALAPIGFAAIGEAAGGRALAAVALLLSLICFVPMVILERRSRAVAPGA